MHSWQGMVSKQSTLDLSRILGYAIEAIEDGSLAAAKKQIRHVQDQLDAHALDCERTLLAAIRLKKLTLAPAA